MVNRVRNNLFEMSDDTFEEHIVKSKKIHKVNKLLLGKGANSKHKDHIIYFKKLSLGEL